MCSFLLSKSVLKSSPTEPSYFLDLLKVNFVQALAGTIIGTNAVTISRYYEEDFHLSSHRYLS